MSGTTVVPFHQLMWPVLQVIKAEGGTASNAVIQAKIRSLGFCDRARKNGTGSELAYRLHWATTYLKKANALENRKRGVWTVTPHGQSLLERDLSGLHRAIANSRRAAPLSRHAHAADNLSIVDQARLILSYVDQGLMERRNAERALRALAVS